MGKFPADSTTAPTRENTPTVQNEISQLIHLGCADLPTSDVKTNQNTVVGLLVHIGASVLICFLLSKALCFCRKAKHQDQPPNRGR